MGLFAPAWQSKNKEKALRAVSRLTDQVILADIAGQDYLHEEVRKAATEKVSDQSILANLAKNSFNDTIGVLATEKLIDQALLFDVAHRGTNLKTQRTAISKLTDQTMLAEIVQSNKSDYVRIEAIKSITDQELLVQVAKAHTDSCPERMGDSFSHKSVRVAAAQRLDNKYLAQQILDEINRAMPISAKQSQTRTQAQSAKQPDSYKSFAASVRHNINARDYDKVVSAIEKLANKDILAEIIRGSEGEWSIDRGSDNFGPYNIIDLRDTARKRLVEIKSYVGSIKQEQLHSEIDMETTGQPTNDLGFILQSLNGAQRVYMKGLIEGALIMTPENAQKAQKLPQSSGCLYQVLGLKSGWHGDVVFSLNSSDNPRENLNLGDIVPHYGFPKLCLKCRKPAEKHILLSSLAAKSGVRLSRTTINAPNAREIYEALQNRRHFWAIPCCEEHNLAIRFFVDTNNSLYTDDKDVIDTCAQTMIR